MTIAVNLAKILLNFIYMFFKLFRRRKQITLVSRESNSITDDYRLLESELKKELPEYKIVVMCKMMDNKFLYFFHMLKQMYHISRSKIVILDTYCFLISNLKHKKGLEVIQIWHAIGILKKAGYSILDTKEGRSTKMARLANMHKGYTRVYTTSKKCIPFMSQVFNCDEKIISSVPLPRIDLLKNNDLIKTTSEKIYELYPDTKNKINILYAPTFRKDETLMKEKIDELCKEIDFKKYNLILKLHPLSKIKIENKNAIIDNYFSTSEMIYISSFVISDYSSIIYEAGIQKKKLLFYAFDLYNYKNSRNFFIDYEKDLPGPIFINAKGIMEFISKDDYSKYKNNHLIEDYVDLKINNYTLNMCKEIKKLL